MELRTQHPSHPGLSFYFMRDFLRVFLEVKSVCAANGLMLCSSVSLQLALYQHPYSYSIYMLLSPYTVALLSRHHLAKTFGFNITLCLAECL